MPEEQLLSFVSNEDLYACTKKVIDKALLTIREKEKTLYKNVIDPFSAVFDSMIQCSPMGKWLDIEKTRQVQKTLQNSIGEFHQCVIGCIDGWEDLKTGGVVDLRNKNEKIIAEVKNKFNTTKGNNKITIYDDLKSRLDKEECEGYTGYYVEIIRSSKLPYNKIFTPSDNRTGKNRAANERIRRIDGQSFYTLATNSETALQDLYQVLPIVINDILKQNVQMDETYKDLFKRAYNIEI